MKGTVGEYFHWTLDYEMNYKARSFFQTILEHFVVITHIFELSRNGIKCVFGSDTKKKPRTERHSQAW